MLRFFKKKAAPAVPDIAAAPDVIPAEAANRAVVTDAAITDDVTAADALVAAAVNSSASTAGWFSRLKSGLSKTGKQLSSLFIGVKVDDDLFDALETTLIMADAGMAATDKLLTALRKQVKAERIEDASAVKAALQNLLTAHLAPLEARQAQRPSQTFSPCVIMVAGVNGAGKTTTIGKLTHTFRENGKSVLLVAGDTFRAAAREQLSAWASRNDVAVISQTGGDPAAVAFDAVQSAIAKKIDVVLIDTAGRLATQLHLMDEIKKIKRVVTKAMPNVEIAAPQEIWLIVDGTMGQNALAQIHAFDNALGLTGLIVTKLDGSAKGGVLAALATQTAGQRLIPVHYVGVGEGLNDLQPFRADAYSEALLST